MIYNHLLAPIDEIKEIPIKINTKGDLLINRFKKMDYEAEYAKAHKLLVEYDRANNTEAMKNELAHLWSMMIQIENKLYGPKDIDSVERRKLFKARAKMIGDFKKYMPLVQKSDPQFDFGTYYSNSPYSDDTIKVSNSTINGLLRMVKTILH